MIEQRYTVRIRCNATGEVREHRGTWHCDDSRCYTGDWRDGFEFQWTEGNYACDCNRANFFARAGGEDDVDVDCWPEGRYTAIDATFESGEVIALDGD